MINRKTTKQKIIIAVIIVTLCSFIFPTYSSASLGGMLFDPISNLITTVGDTILALLQSYLYNGSFNMKAGLGSIFMGAGYFKSVMNNNYDGFKEMTYNDYGGTVTPVQIDSSEFDNIDIGSVLLLIVSPVAGAVTLALDAATDLNWMIPTLQYSVDKIFAGKIPAFEINFINPKYSGNYTDANGDGVDDRTGDTKEDFERKKEKSIANSIQDSIKKWYNALRNLAIVVLLSVLVYTGIRIIISSAAEDRAKYKQRLLDWLVAMCLVFVMHYIMLLIVSMIEIINNTISSSATSIPVVITGKNLKFNTDLLGLVRLQVQYKDFTPKLIYTILYIALLVYTCKYTWIYMKRTITMAFLTIIAPLVAMTYPIDKMNDGKAQAFNAWLKEYFFTALLQPFHLILYTVLVGSALDIATSNPLYAIMAIAFMGPAENLLKKFFGFDKASTPGTLSQAGAMFGGAAAMNLMKKGAGRLMGKAGGHGGKEGGGSVRTKPNAIEDKNAPSSIGDLTDSMQQNDSDTNNSINTNEPKDQNEVLAPEGPQSKLGQLAQAGWNKATSVSENIGSNAMSHIKPIGTKLANGGRKLAENVSSHIPDGLKSEYSNIKKDLAGTAIGKRYTGIRNASRDSLKRFAKNNLNLKDARVRKKIGKKALKLAGRAAMTGTMGAIGVGMGMAGNDLEDVLTFGATGGALGFMSAPGIGNKIANSELGQAVQEEYGRAVYGSDNAAEVEREKQRQFETGEKRTEAMSYYDENGNHYTGEKLAELEQRLIEHDVGGLSSASDRKKAIKIEDKVRAELAKNLPPPDDENYKEAVEKQNQIARDTAQVATKVASTIESKKLNTAEGQEEIKNLFTTELINKNIDKSSASNEAEKMLGYVLSIHKKPRMN